MQNTRVIPSSAVIALCALVVVAEGYDLIVYGALLPALLKEPGWGLTGATAGLRHLCQCDANKTPACVRSRCGEKKQYSR